MARTATKPTAKAPIPYYVVVPFVRTEDGDLVPGEAQEAPSANSARIRARAMLSAGNAGAIAFTRTYDPASSEVSEPTLLLEVGEVDAAALCE